MYMLSVAVGFRNFITGVSETIENEHSRKYFVISDSSTVFVPREHVRSGGDSRR